MRFTRASRVLLLLVGLLSAAAGQDTRPAQASPEATAYLGKVLDILQKHSLRRDKIDWAQLRAKTLAKAGAAQTPAQTHNAIRFALEQLKDNHSFLLPPPTSIEGLLDKLLTPRQPEPSGKMIDKRWAYVVVPACDGSVKGSRQAYLDRLLGIVRELDRQKPAGWVIDLRGNEGGDMWPMLAGIGPVLGEGELGAFVGPDGVKKKWSYRDGKVLEGTEVAETAEVYRLKQPAPTVAVLTDGKTASSGEAVAIAFRGRPKTRSFGQNTAGLSTANEEFPLSDGAILILTVATMADRKGAVYGGTVEPDAKIEARGAGDPILKAALAWLEEQARTAEGK
jgi:hypothetical protein